MNNKELIKAIENSNKKLYLLYSERCPNEVYELNKNRNIKIEVNSETNEGVGYELYNDGEYIDTLKTLGEAMIEGLLEDDHTIPRRSIRKSE